ncbi:restriction endonuclease subunit S [Faecalibacter bovis]|uniref:Restriction endonuclease subunit S n=1 Tax=Faecalibacter bovis TaxID=2898187 RepID=A0ABX7XHR0_9FLAO|nr:restriction endonuclease subunit S [Faecalibacter bovis]QTV07009.1 restriction endonuclease subunit S [Faecalibacter bovis]
MNSFYLKDLLEIKNGSDHKHLNDGNIPVYGSGGLMRMVDTAIYKDESILLPRKGTLSNIQYTNKPFWTVDTLYYTIVNKEKAVPYYLYHYLKRLDLSNLNSGTGVPSMTFGAYYGVKINLPNLPTQQKIAAVLSALDDKIEVNNKINAALEAMAKTLYDYWFVQFEFPNVEGKPYKSAGGKMVYNPTLKREIPEGWEVKFVDDLLRKNENNLKLNAKEYSSEGKFPIVDQSTDFIAGFSDKEDYKIDISVDFPAIVFGDHTRILKLINFDFIRGADGTQVLFSNNERLPQILFYHSLLKIDLSNYGYARHFKFLKDSMIILPHLDLANKFERKANIFYKKILNNQKQNQELAQLRDWLLPMLMNGQVTVE